MKMARRLDCSKEGVEAKAAVACLDDFGGCGMFSRKGGAFAQKVCGAGVLGAVAGVVFRGEDGDCERFAEMVQVASKFC